jgi:hypothetical protein
MFDREIVRNDVVQTPVCQFVSWQRGPPHIRNILYLPAWPAHILLYRPASHPPHSKKDVDLIRVLSTY